MKLIVNADDFGYSKGVNLGIVEAHRDGVVSSATMMVNMPGLEHAVRLAKENPFLGVGIHLVLTCGSPVSGNVPTLTDENGRFRRGQEHLGYADTEDVEREFLAQLERFWSTGLKLTHVDSHHHVHTHETVLPVVLRLADRFGLPIRNPWTYAPRNVEQGHRVSTTEGFSHHFYGDDLTGKTFIQIVDGLAKYSTAEIMTHPAYLDEELLVGSSYSRQRARELQVLTSSQVKDFIKQSKVQLAAFNEIG